MKHCIIFKAQVVEGFAEMILMFCKANLSSADSAIRTLAEFFVWYRKQLMKDPITAMVPSNT